MSIQFLKKERKKANKCLPEPAGKDHLSVVVCQDGCVLMCVAYFVVEIIYIKLEDRMNDTRMWVVGHSICHFFV
eukprot:m.82222 g.82222  ORF g.82222 m.82222 type:complete len:74 (-) comp25498_c0_seq3:79-300(-)